MSSRQPTAAEAIPVHSEDAERAVVLTVLAHGYAGDISLIEQAFRDIRESDFYIPRYRDLWPMLRAFFEERGILEEAGFAGWAGASDKLGSVGGQEGLGRLWGEAARRTGNLDGNVCDVYRHQSAGVLRSCVAGSRRTYRPPLNGSDATSATSLTARPVRRRLGRRRRPVR